MCIYLTFLCGKLSTLKHKAQRIHWTIPLLYKLSWAGIILWTYWKAVLKKLHSDEIITYPWKFRPMHIGGSAVELMEYDCYASQGQKHKAAKFCNFYNDMRV